MRDFYRRAPPESEYFWFFVIFHWKINKNLWIRAVNPPVCWWFLIDFHQFSIENREKSKIFTFRGCPSMEIFYMIPIMLLCTKKWFSTKKSVGRVSRLVHKGPPFAVSPRWNRLPRGGGPLIIRIFPNNVSLLPAQFILKNLTLIAAPISVSFSRLVRETNTCRARALCWRACELPREVGTGYQGILGFS